MTITIEEGVRSDRFPYVESRALKKKFEEVKANAGTYAAERDVHVGFVFPDWEVSKATFPGIYLSYGPVTRATEREVRGPALLGYAPPGYPTDVLVPADMADKDSDDEVDWGVQGFTRESSPYWVPDHPIPYNLDFNIAVLTRNYQQNYEIIQQLADIARIPERFGWLEVPEDGTVRTLELLGGPETSGNRDEDGKRLIQTLYTVRVSAELSLYDVEVVKRVQTIDISLI